MKNISSVARWAATSRGVALSIALAVALTVVLIFTSDSASAVNLTVNNLPNSVTQGQSLQFKLNLDISPTELIPVQSLEMVIDGPGTTSDITVTFTPYGTVTTGDPHVSLALCSSCLGGAGTGYGLLQGTRVGYQSSSTFNFGYGYGYGFGTVNPVVTKFEYNVTLNTGAAPQMTTGSYGVTFKLNTGDIAKPNFTSSVSNFQITAPPIIPPTPTNTPLPPPAAQVEDVADTVQDLPLEQAAKVVGGLSGELAAAVITDIAENVSAQQAAEIVSSLTNIKAAEVIQNVTPEVATKVAEEMANTNAKAAATILETVPPEKAAQVIEKTTIDAATKIIDQASDVGAGAILSKASALAGADIVEALDIEKAAPVMDNVEPKKAGAIMATVDTETKVNLVKNMSKFALINTLSETPILAIKEISIDLLLQTLPQLPASQLVITDPPKLNPFLPPQAPFSEPTNPNLVTYSAQTSEGDWGTLVSSPAPLHKILGKFNKSLSSVKIGVENVIFRPTNVPNLPDGVTPVEFFRLTMENAQPQDLVASHVTFFVTQQVMAANQFHKWGILLHRYNEATGKWETLETTRIAEDSAKVYYSTVVPGFSLFAISGTKTAATTRFEVTNLQVPSQVIVGQTANISADIKNVSAEERSYTAVLYLDNAAEAVQTVQIGAGKSLKVSFGVQAPLGQHTVRLEKQSASYRVTTQPAATATPTPTRTPTATLPGPTATPTATMPAPTATPTTAPVATATPTATTAPAPTPTPTVTPTTPPEEDDGGISAGAVILIVLVVAGGAALAYGGYTLYRRRQGGAAGP
ncbi:MAG: PGF-pre-PGF domain-containing protein [SAR202 cluster bacterium]|nr:PGF-pre-PGF domain-containing protein [SAR202 cluster bacterium]